MQRADGSAELQLASKLAIGQADTKGYSRFRDRYIVGEFRAIYFETSHFESFTTFQLRDDGLKESSGNFSCGAREPQRFSEFYLGEQFRLRRR